MKTGNPKLRVVYALWAFLECLGFGGLIYGWGSLLFVLKTEGLYKDLCPLIENQTDTDNSTILLSENATSTNQTAQKGNCPERDARLNLVFTIGTSMFCVGCFVMGQINFKFGTRVSRIGATALFVIGSLLVAFTSNDVPWLIFPGLSMLGAGGITFLMSNMQISVLFPKLGTLIVGLLCGGFDASSGVQLLVKVGHENGISRKTSYIILAVTNLVTLVSTFLFLPKDFIKQPVKAVNRRPDDIAGDQDAAVELKGFASDTEVQEKKPSLLACMRSMIYIFHVFWLSILQLRFYFLLGSLNKTFETVLSSEEQVSHFTNVLIIVLMCGVATSPFAGIFCDIQKQFFVNSKSALRKKLMPSVIPLALCTTLCIVMSVLMLIEEPTVLYAVFVFLLFFRSFMYTVGAGYISAIFPSEYFGIMYGFLIIVGGVVSFLQYVFFIIAESHGFYSVNVFLLALMFTTYLHPLFQWWKCCRAERTGTLLISF
ncbi:equilibrative nucleobase transporter 1-like [Physella acuta]|uniref:equilibrative nucleobase transporter 1-like n=1 Tax=Physella acuta TaxID=109671 RepID=UPI0027DBF376|nr:equilibrative nucleobase transporter 1-like [Physella acuta]